MDNYRNQIIEKLIPYFQKNDKYFLMISDMGFGAITKFIEKLPERFINCGIMEQASVGICSGMAMTGMIPIFYSVPNFLVYRALEQIRNDVILQKQNVKLIGTGANDYFKFLGSSHCCGEQDIEILKIIGLDVYNPYEKETTDFDLMVDNWVTSPNPGYIRV